MGVGPVMEVRYSRRLYAIVCCMLTAAGVVAALFHQTDIRLFIGLIVAAAVAINLFSAALGGWLAALSAWFNLANIGAGVTIAGIVASLFGAPLCARLPLRRLYLGIGAVGALFTLSILLLNRTPVAFGIATIGENAFQALAYTVAMAIILRTIGHGNPAASTEFSVLGSALNLPLFYMQFVDGHSYAWRGLAGEFAADAGVSILACALMLGVLGWVRVRRGR